MEEGQGRKQDRRVIKTKRAIRNALAVLMTEKSYNDITIKDIADCADINRKTFYNYYRGVYQVVEEIENELVSKMAEIIGDLDFESCIENPSYILKKINEVMNEDLDFYAHLFSLKDGLTLTQKVVTFFKDTTKETLREQFPEMEEVLVDVVLDYTLTGVISVYHRWFNSSREISLDELSQIAGNLAMHGFQSFVVKHS